MNLKFERLHEAAQLPTRANPTDSGMDLYAIEDVVLLPGVPTLARTGLAVELPDGGDINFIERPKSGPWGAVRAASITFEAQIRPRSGLAAKHGITVVNSPGTVDNSYRGEIKVILLWGGHAPNAWAWQKQGDIGVGGYKHYKEFTDGERHAIGVIHPYGYKIRKGDRIAQLVVAPVVLCGAEWADKLSATDRGGSGFGSTGK